LLVVIAIIAVLSGILLPALARSKAKAQGVFCLNNTRQLSTACMMYTDDHNGHLPYNLGAGVSNAAPMNANWADNVLTWDLDADNTNWVKLVSSGLGPYANKSAGVFRCPTDYVLDQPQKDAGWKARVRSYSMNAMIGDAGSFSEAGFNLNNRDYVQFFKYASIPRPSEIFVFIDEHPDSIDDGYFLNKAQTGWWHDLPASYHDGAASLSFADGHSEMHPWKGANTKPKAAPDSISRPLVPKGDGRKDFVWILSVMSVERNSEYYHYY
jgi:prepilin-type processing-associated H-X9-DG protein